MQQDKSACIKPYSRDRNRPSTTACHRIYLAVYRSQRTAATNLRFPCVFANVPVQYHELNVMTCIRRNCKYVTSIEVHPHMQRNAYCAALICEYLGLCICMGVHDDVHTVPYCMHMHVCIACAYAHA